MALEGGSRRGHDVRGPHGQKGRGHGGQGEGRVSVGLAERWFGYVNSFFVCCCTRAWIRQGRCCASFLFGAGCTVPARRTARFFRSRLNRSRATWSLLWWLRSL